MLTTAKVTFKTEHTDWDIRPYVRLDLDDGTRLYVPAWHDLSGTPVGATVETSTWEDSKGFDHRRVPAVVFVEEQEGWDFEKSGKKHVRVDVNLSGKKNFKKGAAHFYVPEDHALASVHEGDGIKIVAV